MSERTKYILFTAAVNAQTMGKLREAVIQAHNSRHTEIYILFSSTGGDVHEGLNMAAILKSLPLKIVMHNIGQTDSVANVIFAAGDTRYAQTNSNFLFHGVMLNLNTTQALESQLNEAHKNCIRMREDIAKNFATYAGIELAEVAALMADGATILNAQEAQLKGIIHDIRNPEIPVGSQITSIGNE
jgi:ATP-dependent Clp protease, protease subunit